MRFIKLRKDMVFTAWAASFSGEKRITAKEGKEAGFGTIAVNRAQIPFGTVLEVETVDDGKKYIYTGIAEDDIKLEKGEEDLTLKLWFKNCDFGTRWVKITVKETAGAASMLTAPANFSSANNTTLASGYLASSNISSFVLGSGLNAGVLASTPTVKIGDEFKGDAVAYDEEGSTSTGGKTGVGVVAINPKKIPYHTKLKISREDKGTIYGKNKNGVVGYHNEVYVEALDTGGDVGKDKILVDIWMPTKAMNAFGRRKVTMTVV